MNRGSSYKTPETVGNPPETMKKLQILIDDFKTRNGDSNIDTQTPPKAVDTVSTPPSHSYSLRSSNRSNSEDSQVSPLTKKSTTAKKGKKRAASPSEELVSDEDVLPRSKKAKGTSANQPKRTARRGRTTRSIPKAKYIEKNGQASSSTLADSGIESNGHEVETNGDVVAGNSVNGNEATGADSTGNDAPENSTTGNDGSGNDGSGNDGPGNDGPGNDGPGNAPTEITTNDQVSTVELFHCANRNCNTGMTYLPMAGNSRKVISGFFGRNKKPTSEIPFEPSDTVWHIYCRKCYQRDEYAHKKHPMRKLDYLLKNMDMQLDRIALWRPQAKFLVQLNKAAKERIGEYYKVYHQHDEAAAVKAVARTPKTKIRTKPKGKQEEEELELSLADRFPIKLLLEFDETWSGKETKSIAELRPILTWIWDLAKNGKIDCMPPMEFLLRKPAPGDEVNDTKEIWTRFCEQQTRRDRDLVQSIEAGVDPNADVLVDPEKPKHEVRAADETNEDEADEHEHEDEHGDESEAGDDTDEDDEETIVDGEYDDDDRDEAVSNNVGKCRRIGENLTETWPGSVDEPMSNGYATNGHPNGISAAMKRKRSSEDYDGDVFYGPSSSKKQK